MRVQHVGPEQLDLRDEFLHFAGEAVGAAVGVGDLCDLARDDADLVIRFQRLDLVLDIGLADLRIITQQEQDSQPVRARAGMARVGKGNLRHGHSFFRG
jgi:hypothetical protein